MQSKKTEKMQCTRYTNGIILPRMQMPDGPMWGLGGVCDSENRFVKSSFYDGGWAKHGGFYEWEKEEYIDEDVVYIGMFYSHWGHFLIDLTGRMWFFQHLIDEDRDFKVAYLGEEEPHGNNLAFFRLLGIREEQLIHIKHPTRFRNVYVPEQSFKSCEWYTDEFIQMFDSMVEKVLTGKQDFSKYENVKKIYFTRRHFGKAQGTEFGESYFESRFIANGYQAIAPEEATLEEQIFIWNHAEQIVCINGTIPLNVLFSKNKNLNLIVLNKMSLLHENPLILLEMRGIQAEFLNIYKEPLKGYPKSLGEGPYLLNATHEFEVFCENEDIREIWSAAQKERYFKQEERKYYFCVLGIRRKVRGMILNLIPEVVKERRRAKIINENGEG